jgi:hypothetical protein
VAVLFLVAFLALMGTMAALFAVLVGRRYRREQARRGTWSDLAARLGLRHERGDPLGLAERLSVTRVTETLWGVLDGARVAAITASVFRPGSSPLGAGPTLSTFSGAVAQVDPPARFDDDAVRAWLVRSTPGEPPNARVAPNGDLVLLTPPGHGWRTLHDPADAATAEWLLRQAAGLARQALRA